MVAVKQFETLSTAQIHDFQDFCTTLYKYLHKIASFRIIIFLCFFIIAKFLLKDEYIQKVKSIEMSKHWSF